MVIVALEDALNRHDLDAVAALHADGVSHQGFAASRADFMRVWADILRTFPDYHARIDRLLAEDDWVVELMTLTGTHLGRAETSHHSMPVGIEPTGRRLRAQQAHFWRIRDGRIVEHEVVRDDLGLLRQLGLAE